MMVDGPGHSKQLVPVGRISGLYGVNGWVKVFSYTDPRDNIVHYSPWYLNRADGLAALEVVAGRRHGKGVIVKLAGCDDRDAAAQLVGLDIGVYRDQLPAPERGEFYWVDLIGMVVRTTDGQELGRVNHLIETGSNDVLVVDGDRERLIPFIQGSVIRSVDPGQGLIEVDWDPGF